MLLNRDKVQHVRVAEMNVASLGSTATGLKYMLGLEESLAAQAGETEATHYVGSTVAIDANGGASSKLLITIAEKNHTYSAAEATETSTSHTFDGSTYTTLKDIVDAINDTSGLNVKAHVRHGLHSTPTNVDTWQDLSAAGIGQQGRTTECLLCSDAAASSQYLRFGVPTLRDAQMVRILRIEGTSSHAAGTLKLYRDEYGKDLETLFTFTPVASLTTHLSYDIPNAPVFRGPLVLAWESVTSGTSANYRVHYQLVEI